MKATAQYFPVVLFTKLHHEGFLTFESVDEIFRCDHSNESLWAVLSCGTVYYAAQLTPWTKSEEWSLTHDLLKHVLLCKYTSK